MSAHPIPILGLVGGVGSGKSTLARELSRQWRVQVLDADAAGHDALQRPAVQQALRTAFGDEIFEQHGAVSRSRLASVVFGDSPEHAVARQRLEAIVHPVIRQQLEREVRDLQALRAVDLIVLDAAVMLESGWSKLCDAIAFVDVPIAVRQQRVLQTRGWLAEELARREASQWPLQHKRAAAHVVIPNESDVALAAGHLLAFLIERFPQLPRSVERSTDAELRCATVSTATAG